MTRDVDPAPAPFALQGRRIVLGVTGGVAAYKAAELQRLLIAHGAEVDVVLTESACRFVNPVTFQALGGRPVYTDLWDHRPDNAMAHINLTRGADLVLVAPATTNFMARLAQGLCDDLLTTLCIASPIPLALAPAMNREMWLHPATQRNVQQLRADGVTLLGPAEGVQACGETGLGRMLEPVDLLGAVSRLLGNSRKLAGKTVLVTAGPTEEPIDPVRVITNRSSGKMGYAIAAAAQRAGARVILVSGPVSLPTPPGVERINVRTAREMHATVMQHVDLAHAFIGVAAVADWAVAQPAEHKLKKTTDGAPQLSFVQNPDILAEVAARPHPPFCVGFAAETRDLQTEAPAKRARKGVPLLIGNLAQDTFGADVARWLVCEADGVIEWPSLSKAEAARRLMDLIAERLP